jgi:acyl carrier protein
MLNFETLVIDHLRSFNEQLPETRRLALRPDAVVSGPDARFDSLDSVEFIMGLEEKLAVLFGRRVDISHPVEALDQEIVTVADVTVCVEQLLSRFPMAAAAE